MGEMGSIPQANRLFRWTLLILSFLFVAGCQYESSLSALECADDEDCGDNALCSGGFCIEPADAGLGDVEPSCPGDQEFCDGRCVDINFDRQHCGLCGNACPSGTTCSMQECVLLCGGGSTLCPGEEQGQDSCRDLQSDPNHCGACGFECPDNETCLDGECQKHCGPDLIYCENVDLCANLENDRDHCGLCEKSCDSDQVCREGLCVANCPPGFVDVDGTCRNPLTDPEYCGATGQDCPDATNGVGVCVAGVCRLRCDELYAFCEPTYECIDANFASCQQ